MSIYISGSLAFDRIMAFKGNFQESIIPDKLHALSISFMVDRMEEQFGGCAGNIAYTLALIGEKPYILASAGRDFGSYAKHLEALGLPLDGIAQDDELFTALCYITTDITNNQITGFYPGAMTLPSRYGYPNVKEDVDVAIVSPGNLNDMRALPEYYKNRKVRYIYDPGQQLPVLTAENLLQGIEGSFALTINDYELEMICQKTGKTQAEIEALTQHCITTYGEKGASVTHKGVRTDIPAVIVPQVVDPTGAGDAHRAGLLKGLHAGLDIIISAQIASTCASFAIEKCGTQMHTITKEAFTTRYMSQFGSPPEHL